MVYNTQWSLNKYRWQKLMQKINNMCYLKENTLMTKGKHIRKLIIQNIKRVNNWYKAIHISNLKYGGLHNI